MLNQERATVSLHQPTRTNKDSSRSFRENHHITHFHRLVSLRKMSHKQPGTLLRGEQLFWKILPRNVWSPASTDEFELRKSEEIPGHHFVARDL
jgi:hypothetical protein